VAIADRYVLTAAHVAAPAGTCIVTFGKQNLRVSRVYVHHEWEPGRLGHDDIALLETADSIGLSWYPPLSEGSEEPGSVCSIAGYGVSGPISTGYSVSDGRLRAGTNTVARFERGVIVCLIARLVTDGVRDRPWRLGRAAVRERAARGHQLVHDGGCPAFAVEGWRGERAHARESPSRVDRGDRRPVNLTGWRYSPPCSSPPNHQRRSSPRMPST